MEDIVTIQGRIEMYEQQAEEQRRKGLFEASFILLDSARKLRMKIEQQKSVSATSGTSE